MPLPQSSILPKCNTTVPWSQLPAETSQIECGEQMKIESFTVLY
jgi:hypothetical protein